jgi:hypothetical protein
MKYAGMKSLLNIRGECYGMQTAGFALRKIICAARISTVLGALSSSVNVCTRFLSVCSIAVGR